MIGPLLFFVGLAVIAYHLVGYPFLLYLFARHGKAPASEPLELPTVTAVCAAYNEAAHIEEKIRSFLALDYPRDRLRLIVISDESTDGTDEIVRRYEGENVRLVVQRPRAGKVSAQNMVEPEIDSQYILSTDANSIFRPDALKKLVATIESDPHIGIVSGELRLIRQDGEDSGEGLYWRYESHLKRLESRVCSILGANGSIYLIRRELFRQMPPASVDDFERVLNLLQSGYVGKYVPEAVVTEYVTQKPHEEIGRKVRIIQQEWFSVRRCKSLLNPLRNPLLSFMLVSHKILRWTFFLWAWLLLAGNVLLLDQAEGFGLLLGLQVIGYTLGFAELWFESKGESVHVLKPCGYLAAMIWASQVAFFRFLTAREQAVWTTVRE